MRVSANSRYTFLRIIVLKHIFSNIVVWLNLANREKLNVNSRVFRVAKLVVRKDSLMYDVAGGVAETTGGNVSFLTNPQIGLSS